MGKGVKLMREKISVNGFSYRDGVSFTGENYFVRAVRRNGETRLVSSKRPEVSNRETIRKLPFVRGLLHLWQTLPGFWPALVFIFLVGSSSSGRTPEVDTAGFQLGNYLKYLIPIGYFVYFKLSIWSRYHAAEHKVLNVYLGDKELTLDNAARAPRTINSCLTTFFVSYLVLMLLSRQLIGSFSFDLLVIYLVSVEILLIRHKAFRWILTPLLWFSKAFQYIIYTSEPQSEDNELALMGMEKLIELESNYNQ